jgi:hypothetical protein
MHREKFDFLAKQSWKDGQRKKPRRAIAVVVVLIHPGGVIDPQADVIIATRAVAGIVDNIIPDRINIKICCSRESRPRLQFLII